MRNKLNILQIFVLLVLSTTWLFGQNAQFKFQENGQPFVRYFGPKEYKAETVNWKILQDNRGVIYIGNGTGVLEYDGASWRKIRTPKDANVRAMALDSNGTIFVCATGDFGYLTPDSLGQLQYKSLLPYLDKKYHKFGEMWDVIASSKEVYFKTREKIFGWNGSKISVWDSVFSYRFYNVNDTIYTRNDSTGLMYIDGDSLKLMPNGEYFASTGVFNMLPFDGKNARQKGRILITSNLDGMFIHDGKKFSKFKTDADSFLIKNQIYNACITSNGNYALATQRGGVAILNPKGHLIRVINEKSGIPTNVIFNVFNDRYGGLWLATVNGVAYCEYPSPFTIFKNYGLLKNISYSVYRYKNKLYVTNELGVLYLPDKYSTFKLIEGSNKPAYALLDVGGILLAGTNWGASVIENGKLQEPLVDPSVNALLKSELFPDRIYVGHRKGISVIRKSKNNKLAVSYTKILEDEVNAVVEEGNGNLWLTGFFPGLYHVSGNMQELSTGNDQNIEYKFYDENNGLPGTKWSIYKVKNKMLLTSDKGVFRFDSESQKFLPDSTLGKIFIDSTNSIVLLKKSIDGNYWVLAELKGKRELGKAVLQSDGNYKWQPSIEFRRLDLSSAIALYSDIDPNTNKEILWISTDEALVRYDSFRVNKHKTDFPTLVRKVIVSNDSLIYGGAEFPPGKNNKISLPFSQNDIRFDFAAPSFDKSGATKFQYFLKGNDEDWSQWTTENKKEYTNLSQGKYQFYVRSKNVYGSNGEENIFTFTVLPPWYLSWWAFVLYGLLFALGVFIVDRIMRRKLIERERERAKLREAELIKMQAEELETVDRLVRIINSAKDLETLFNSLLVQTVSFIPAAEKAAVFLLDHIDGLFHIAYTLGYNVDDLDSITFSPEELHRRYTEDSVEIEKGIYIISNTEKMYADEKMSKFSKAKSMLVMAVDWDQELEAYVVFDSFADKNAFDPSTARILNKFREHAVSAIRKAQSIKILQEKNEEIVRTQEQLVTQQKLASLGALTAGIAHEIKNPLNFVNNLAEVSSEILDELSGVLDKDKKFLPNENYNEISELMENLQQIFNKINAHGNRADSIIKGMLLHSRESSGDKTLTDLNELVDQYINLVYHGLRAKDKKFNIRIEKNYDDTLGKINLVQQDISRVLLNVINNACYAAYKKKCRNGAGFDPTLKVWTNNLAREVEIHVWDNGDGIPPELKDKLFNPFFTTKPSGEGTGLGLSISYDIIVKQHRGEIKFDTKEGEFTEFIISLPKN
ncbi:sensor protein ZraS [bacterium BMS3Abin04]|nr:sensor protein ZraS [bacterium BMS3Abin04]